MKTEQVSPQVEKMLKKAELEIDQNGTGETFDNVDDFLSSLKQ